MTNLQLFLHRACHDLELNIVVPFLLTVSESAQINAQALLPQLGARNGMIIVKRFDDLCGRALELSAMGYGYSVLDEPLPSEDYDLESYIEMFCDWGWSSVTQSEPSWMN